MVQTKNRSTPVVEKKQEKKADCGCGCKDCTCGPDCKCGCNCGLGKTFWKCTTMLVSAVLIGGSVLLQPCISETLSSKRPAPVTPQVSEKDFRDFIRKNPKFLADTITEYQEKQVKKAAAVKPAAAAAEAQKPAEFNLNDLQPADAELVASLVNDPTNYSLGNKDGKFVIIEFFDYQCGWCKRTNKGLEEVIESAEGKNIRWIPIDTPIFGPASETISRYVLAAGEQGKYAEMHKAVGAAPGRLDENALLEIAKTLNLNVDKLKADANGQKIKDKMAANQALARKLDIRGVPMLIVDGRINSGALIGDRLNAIVKLSAQK